MASIGHQIDISSIQPKGENVLCIRYERPEATPGGIIIPDPFRVDPFWAYWEVVKAGPAVERTLGIAIRTGDIIRTPFRPAIDSGFEDSCRRRLYFIACTVKQVDSSTGKLESVSNITGVIPNTWDTLESI